MITKRNYILALFTLLFFISCTDMGSKDKPVLDENRVTVTYSESPLKFPNPERGFYTHYAFSSAGAGQELSSTTVKAQRRLGRTLMLNLYYLRDFRTGPISQEYLSLIEKNMLALRNGGGKCVLRFAYTSNVDDTPWDPPVDIVMGHIEQLKPLLQEYADVIYVLEAGFVGVWGEWYYTTNFNMSPSSDSEYEPRRNLLNALLDALPEERMICVRTPQFKLKCLNLNLNDTLTREEAYSGSPKARVAAHNDCFLATANDMGTFDNTAQRNFWQADTRYTVMGGETCAVSEYSTCNNAITQMENYHWSYLNSGYHGTVLGNWGNDGCFDEIERRLGYRLVLTEASFSKSPKGGKNFTAEINLKNVGFAAPANPRDVDLVFVNIEDENDVYTLKSDEDPRFWFPNKEISFTIVKKLDNRMTGKRYNVYLNLPDPQTTLNKIPEFSIRLANTNTWNEEMGYNKIHTIEVN